MNRLKKHILLVDGMALLFRGYYATAYRRNFMYNENGIPTNGVYQFLKYFLNAINTYEPTHVICCWDMGKETFRTELYEDYKKNRDEPPKELIPQFDLVKEVVSMFHIPNITAKNYEADDIIGTLTKQLRKHKITVLTGDHDLLQLIQPNVQIALMKKGIGNYELMTNTNIYEKRGLHPEQFVEFKAFTGDSADNYPGVKGIGEKTALKLLQTYGSIESVLNEKNKLSKGIKTRIEENLDMLFLSKKLAKIKCDIPVTVSLNDALLNFKTEDVSQKLSTLGIRPLKELS